MTFSLVGRCARTGQLGACTTTSDIAVGARVPHAKASVGAVLTQHRTDPLLGIRGLDLLAAGCDASRTIDALVASTSHHSWRQLAVVDSEGRTAAFSGSRVQPPYAEERPVFDLRHAWTAYRPLVGEFLTRAIDPDHAGGAA